MEPVTTADATGFVASPEMKPRVHEEIIVDRTTDGDVILLHPWEARWALTNETGLDFLQMLDGASSLAEIAHRIATEAEVEPGVVLGDLCDFVRDLHSCNLLENLPLPVAKASKPRVPSVTIYVTEECNLRCKHCAIVEGKMPATALDGSTIRKLIDEHTAQYPGATISFLGGEPLLRPDCLDLLEYAASRTPVVKMGTNGLLIDDATAQRLAASGAEIQISLDGAVPEVHDSIRGKGTFAKTWRAIEIFCAAGGAQRLVVANVLTRSMLGDLQSLIDQIDSVGPIRTLRFLALNKLKAADTNWARISPDDEELCRIYRWLIFEIPAMDREGKTPISAGFPGFVPRVEPAGPHWCPLGETLIVNSRGKAYNCPVFHTGEYEVGNVQRDSTAEMLGSEKNRAARAMILERRYAIPECRVCAWRNFCQGGCAAFSSLRSGSLHVNDTFCEFRRELYREHVRRTKLKLPESASREV